MANQDNQKTAITPDEFFKARFISLMADLGKNARKDPKTIWLIGSLAGSILADAKIARWSEFKLALAGDAYNSMLSALKTQGNKLAEDGEHKSAYAVETIAISLIAPSMTADSHIATGNKLLDGMIEDAIAFYHKNPAPNPN